MHSNISRAIDLLCHSESRACGKESLIPKSLAVKDVSTALDMTKGHWATRPVDLTQKPQLESPNFFTRAPRRFRHGMAGSGGMKCAANLTAPDECGLANTPS
jgi:hypothetical protein